jgi:hypothetical protein
VDTFVIVSSDSDFVPLVSKLRAAGKSVIGAGPRQGASQTLVKSCDRYIFLDEAVPTQDQATPSRPRLPQSASLLVRAVQASVDDHGQVVGSKLYQAMQRIDPSFDFRALGHRTFAHFLSSSEEVKVTRPTDASDVIVQLNHSTREHPGEHLGERPGERPGERLGERPGERLGEHSERAALSPDWDRQIHTAWSGRQRSRFSGQAAASDAVRVLGVPRLAASRFPSLDKLLDASPFLRANWRRDGNAIVEK